jgi:hypothetical protein
MGRWKMAEQLRAEILERRLVIHGEKGPETLASMHSLANNWINQGYRKKSTTMLGKVLEHRRDVYGYDHALTIDTAKVLVEWEERKFSECDGWAYLNYEAESNNIRQY